MTQKKEAKKLVDKMYSKTDCGINYINDKTHTCQQCEEEAKQCALIAINERIEEANQWKSSFMGNERMNHLQQVKSEIEHL